MMRWWRVAGAASALMPLGSSSCERPPAGQSALASINRYHLLLSQLLPAAQLPRMPWHGANLLGGMLDNQPMCRALAPVMLPELRAVPKVAAYAEAKSGAPGLVDRGDFNLL